MRVLLFSVRAAAGVNVSLGSYLRAIALHRLAVVTISPLTGRFVGIGRNDGSVALWDLKQFNRLEAQNKNRAESQDISEHREMEAEFGCQAENSSITGRKSSNVSSSSFHEVQGRPLQRAH